MKVNLVAYLDANYLHKALVCYDSLRKFYSGKFRMYIYCFDKITFDILRKFNLEDLIPIPKEEFEIPEILSQKSRKKSYEYFWTYTPTVLLQTMAKTPKDEIVVYMDTDMMFFDSPQCIFDELEDKDVLIQPNNFSVKERWQFEPIGYYCTSFNVFRNNDNSARIVKDWQKQCIEWCGATFGEGKFGDQKYMDFWLDKYEGVREVTTVGADVAPWNIQKYDVSNRNGKVFINNKPLIYYHFHSFKMSFSDYSYIIEGDRDNCYDIREDAIKYIYTPYIEAMRAKIMLLKKEPNFLEYVARNPEGNVGWYGNE